MILGIDASNIRAGGGITHLINMLGQANPQNHGFSSVIVWSGKNTLAKIPDFPWLIKESPTSLNKGLLRRSWWR